MLLDVIMKNRKILIVGNDSTSAVDTKQVFVVETFKRKKIYKFDQLLLRKVQFSLEDARFNYCAR